MKFKLQIATLSDLIEEYKDITLKTNKEVPVSDLGISVPTIHGTAIVTHFIKKADLPILEIFLENGYKFKAATMHIVQRQGTDIYLKDITAGDTIGHHDGEIKVVSVRQVSNEDCYDIAIPAPHLYYDANGVIHHNTITTATLSKICEQYGRTITIVPNKSLVEQTEEDFVNCKLDVGVYYGDRKELNKTHTICTWQSLNVLNKKSMNDDAHVTLAEFLHDVNTVIVDEVHQASAEVLRKLLTNNFSNAPIRWGLTGTIPKKEIDLMNIRVSLGDLVNQVKASDLQEKGILSACHINIIQTAEWKQFSSYAAELKYLVTDPIRMSYITTIIKDIAATGNTLILVDRLESGRMLQQGLTSLLSAIPNSPEVAFISGDVTSKDRKEEYEEVKTATNKIIVATYGVAAVGINIPRIFNMVLLEPGKSFVRVIQSIGRGIRKADDKDFVTIYDITASTKYAKKHLTERKRFYKDANYPFSISKVDYTK